MELLSKSVLSELDAATCLISAMTKPAHFMLVISALTKFLANSIALASDKNCQMFHKHQAKVIF
ncbi:unnamed protein product [Gongylonema pulchrum]|uniref:Uncharacterized protein n=1 Tax=Gongylonema pulchrum TaxID=637853 RepID=A0A183F008_9BILA|nr:unnamed protein product [Gongylonema pulchrum]